MTKKELLDILYAERNRLMSLYTRPGWTTWALVGAIASLSWLFLDLYAEESFSWKYTISIFYFLFNLFISIVCFITAFKNNHRPLWTKVEPLLILGMVFAFIIYLAQCIIFIIYKSLFAQKETLYDTTIVVNILLLLYILLVIITSFIPLLRTQKNNLVAGCVAAVLFLLFVVEWGLVVFGEATPLEICNIKAGLIVFAIGVLAGCFNVSTRDKLNKLDNLINRVLYDEEQPDERFVIAELEKCMLGLKYGNFLMSNFYGDVSKKTIELYNRLQSLNETVNSSVNPAMIFPLVNISAEMAKHLKLMLDSVTKMVNLGYDETDLDPKLSPLLHVIQDSNSLVSIWLEIKEKESTYSLEDFKKFVNIKKQEVDIIYNNTYYRMTNNDNK